MKTKIIFYINDMHCQSCAYNIEKNLNKNDLIYEANVNFANEEAKIIFNSQKINSEDIIDLIKKMGFNAKVKTSIFKNEKIKFPLKLILIWIITIFFIINMASSIFLHKIFLPVYIQFILATIIQFFLGFNFYKGIYYAIKNKMANMDVLIVLGTTTIWTYSTIIFFLNYKDYKNIYFEASVMIIAFISTGKYLEEITKKSSLNSIKLILQLNPKKVEVLKKNKWININYSDICINDIIKSSKGQIICADGEILSGEASIDESYLTGEYNLIYKKTKDLVLAGSLINEGCITYKAKTIGEKTLIWDIAKALDEAQGTKPNITKIADKVSAIFIPIVISIAILTFIITYYITKNLQLSIKHLSSVLIIACPCALGLATPASIMVGLGLATKKGILFKDSKSMEKCAKLDAVVFDKTGTLTEGKPKIIDFWIIDNKYNKKELLKYAACAEINSTHPLAKAIVKEAQLQNIKLIKTKNVKDFIGKGIKAQTIKGDTISIGTPEFCDFKLSNFFKKNLNVINNSNIVCIKLNDNNIGAIILSDDLKKNSKVTIEKLNKLPVEIYIMSGDKKSVVNNIAEELNIPLKNVFSNLSYRDKLKKIETLINQKKNVAMVGDGINDSPALAKATIGFAMQNGTDIANNTANIILMKNSISQIYDAILISKATLKNIKQNLFFAFIYNIFSIPLAAIGLLTPIISGLSMTFSSITVLFNALRLKKFKIRDI